jgi:hypothetical protein
MDSGLAALSVLAAGGALAAVGYTLKIDRVMRKLTTIRGSVAVGLKLKISNQGMTASL